VNPLTKSKVVLYCFAMKRGIIAATRQNPRSRKKIPRMSINPSPIS